MLTDFAFHLSKMFTQNKTIKKGAFFLVVKM